MNGTGRGVTPVIATVLLVALAVVIAASVSVFVFTLGSGLSDSAPSVAFETEAEDDSVVLRHAGGDAVDRENLVVRGGNIETAPETLRTASTLEIDPDAGVEEITLVWETERNSAILTSVPVSPGGTLIIAGEPAGIDEAAEKLEGTELTPGESIEIENNGDETVCVEITAEGTSSESLGPLFEIVEKERDINVDPGDEGLFENDEEVEIKITEANVSEGSCDED